MKHSIPFFTGRCPVVRSAVLSSFVALLAVLIGWPASRSSAAPLGTAFSYQGRLITADGPANGTYDLTFSLYTTSSGGTAINPRRTNNGVVVANGLINAELDFGPVFNGTAYWLEVGARTNGAPIFTPMVRQALVAAPNAIFAQTANGVAAGSVTGSGIANNAITAAKLAPELGVWNKSGNDISYSGGNVGIGTANPGYRLTLKGSGNEVYSVMSEDGTQTPDNVTFQIAPGDGSSSTRIGYLFGSFGNSLGFLVANTRNAPLRFGTANAERMRIDAVGNVGIGTTVPGAKLEVRVPGDNATIRLNSGDASGQHYSALDFIDSGNSGWGIGKNPSTNFYIDEGGVANRLTILKGGNVGIGTTAPSTKLEVAGTIKATGDMKLGAAGQYFASAGEENLRIIRGGINPDGSIWTGTGFTVTHLPSTGIYRVDFTQSFSGYHTTTATALDSGPTFVTQGSAGSDFIDFAVWRNGIKVDVSFDFISVGPR